MNAGNIAFTCKNLQHATEKELFEVLGPPKVEQLARLDSMPLDKSLPTQLIKSAEWVDWIDEDEEDIRLLDIGEGFPHGQNPEKLAQPHMLRAPETILTDDLDYRVDLWRIGCIVSLEILAMIEFQN